MRTRNMALVAGGVLVIALAAPAAVGAVAGGSRSAGIPGTAKARPAVAVTGTCKSGKTNYSATNLTGSNTTSTSYVNVPDATVSFTQGGSVSSCVIVHFTAETFANAGGTALLYVRPLLDGGTLATPVETQFSGDDDEEQDGRWARSHAMNFVFPSVSPGGHTIQMQFRSFDGGQVNIHQHTTLVDHR